MEFRVITTSMKGHLPPATVIGKELMCGGIAPFRVPQQDVDSASRCFIRWLQGLGTISMVQAGAGKDDSGLSSSLQDSLVKPKSLSASTKDGEEGMRLALEQVPPTMPRAQDQKR